MEYEVATIFEEEEELITVLEEDEIENITTVNEAIQYVNTGDGSGTSNYTELTNKPKINGVELVGNKTSKELGLESYDDTEIKQDIAELQITKADKDEIPTKLSELENDTEFISNIPDEYVTNDELEAKGYLTEHQSLEDYALKSEIPSIEGLATETYVKNEIANAQLGGEGGEIDLSGYATKDDLNSKVDKETGKSLIADSEITRLAGVTNYDDTEIKNSLNDKANKSDIPTIPTNISSFVNDAGYITEYIEKEVYVGTEEPTNNDCKIWVNPDGEVTDYVTKEEMDNAISNAIGTTLGGSY